MSTLQTIQGSDLPTNNRADINDNFSALNADKLETSVLDTDTTLAANSDAKVATQKAVKAYVDAGGNVNASTTTKGIVEEATQAEVASLSATGGTGARLFMNPSTAGPVFGIKSVTAGATITGATLPVPVYQNKTDNEFYACDGNDTAAMKFLGFAISNGADGAAMTVQFSGIVSGFTGLDEGEKYYLSDTVGTIQNSPGTYEVLVGVAISTTELLIQKGKRYASGTQTFSSTTTAAITLGFRPSRVRISATLDDSATTWGLSHGGWSVAGANDCVYLGINSGDATPSWSGADNAKAWYTYIDITGTVVGHSGTVTTITDTGFTLDNTKASTPGDVKIFWEAEGEL